MLTDIHKLMDEADVVVHYNGTKFDVPTLQREFLMTGMAPPSPVKQLDLLTVVRKQFRFSSNKLDFVCQTLGLGNKVVHKGMALWRGCMDGDSKSWKTMQKYNIQDVLLLEKLYHRILPWIRTHPNQGLFTKKPVCPRCASTKVQSRGVARTATLSYQRFQCTSCGGWIKGAKTEAKAVVNQPI